MAARTPHLVAGRAHADGRARRPDHPEPEPRRTQIGFVGVLPGQRGHGYGYELLAESTHLLADAGANRITATTDTTNTPMVAAFARAGYPITRHRILLTHR